MTLSILFVSSLVAAASPPSGDSLETGRDLYLEHCAECHGASGRGDGEKAKRLGFRPRDFTLGAFKCRSTPTGSPPTHEDLTRIVARGIPGTPMLPFDDDLEPAEIDALVTYVETLLPDPSGGQPPPVLEVPTPLESTEASRREGRAIYRLLGCWRCHGLDGEGDGPAAEGLEDQWGEPIRVYDFTRRNRFKCGGRPRDIYRTLHTGMTGSPMPSFTTAFAFGRDQVGATERLEQALGAEAVDRTLAWLAEQPTAAEIRELDETARAQLVERRTWSLVHHLLALASE
ncbi:MAG: c-type cytochrome [Thermoanaerobaculia bacterium]|nr:c-type cytochrome [Thermoanaerobaculia bacterium]